MWRERGQRKRKREIGERKQQLLRPEAQTAGCSDQQSDVAESRVHGGGGLREAPPLKTKAMGGNNRQQLRRVCGVPGTGGASQHEVTGWETGRDRNKGSLTLQ